MPTDSDDVRNYIAGLEDDRRALAEVRAMIDVFRRNVLPESSVTNRMETDAEVIARLAVGRGKAVRAYDEASARSFTEGRNEGIRLGLRAASFLAGDHDDGDGDEHDACLDALATKILGTTAEGAASLVEAYDRLQQEGSYHLAPGTTGPAVVGDSVYDHLGREVGWVADPANIYAYKLTEVSAFGVETPPLDKPVAWSGPTVEGGMGGARPSALPPKPCPMKDCDLPCDDGHKHLVEKTDEPRSPEVTTIPGKKPIRLRVGQIWRLPAGGERQITGDLWSGIPGSVSLGGASICIDQNNYVTDTGGCTLVYDPRGDK